jgi:hypothetical protein
MIREALEFLFTQAEERATEAEPTYELDDGRTYRTRDDHAVLPAKPDFVPLHTLGGLADYIRSDFDEAPAGRALIVKGPRKVELVSKTHGPFRVRHLLATAEPLIADAFPFDRFLDAEDFMIKALSRFERTEDLDAMLGLLGNLQSEAVRTSADDGVTQIVTVKKGVKVQDVAVKNPVCLCPYRTFQDVAQPSSNYVLRLSNGEEGELPRVGLWEVDDAQWKVRSIEAIQEFLQEALQGADVPIFA